MYVNGNIQSTDTQQGIEYVTVKFLSQYLHSIQILA